MQSKYERTDLIITEFEGMPLEEIDFNVDDDEEESDFEVKSIFDYTYEDFTLEGYDPHPAIKAPLSF